MGLLHDTKIIYPKALKQYNPTSSNIHRSKNAKIDIERIAKKSLSIQPYLDIRNPKMVTSHQDLTRSSNDKINN